MNEEQVNMLQTLALKTGGVYLLNHSKRILELIVEIGKDMSYNKDIITFCAYAHDLGAFAPYTIEGVNHALRSKQIVQEQLINDFSFTIEEKHIIFETIENHHTPGQLKSMEAILFRDADDLEFVGFIGAARDLSRVNLDLAKGIQSIQRHRANCIQNLTLPVAKMIGKKRIEETNLFLEQVNEESFHLL